MTALREAARLCAQKGSKPPFLGIVTAKSEMYGNTSGCDMVEKCGSKVFEVIRAEFQKGGTICYGEMPCVITSLSEWTMHKVRKQQNKEVEYHLYKHSKKEQHLGLQYVLKGILNVYYSEEKSHGKQPGFISFPSGRAYDQNFERIPYHIYDGRSRKGQNGKTVT
ncbi:MAG: hypothetical protein PHN80_06905 [Hespellia sp.]|nr:hypothetical protein [Hespellia sp.]